MNLRCRRPHWTSSLINLANTWMTIQPISPDVHRWGGGVKKVQVCNEREGSQFFPRFLRIPIQKLAQALAGVHIWVK